MLRSANFVFRPFVPSDAQGFVEAVLESTSTLTRWMPWAHEQYSMAEALSWISMCQQGWDQMHGHCNLGYWVRQSFQRRGAATAAIGALSDFAFTELLLSRIEIAVAVGKAASLGTARKAGAVEECVARNRLKFNERFVDAHSMSLVPPTSD
jgi:ribosomal-protein-serine acetyltransferase